MQTSVSGVTCRASGGKLVDATPELETELKNELEKVDRMYGATGPDFLKFPTFSFTGQDLRLCACLPVLNNGG